MSVSITKFLKDKQNLLNQVKAIDAIPVAKRTVEQQYQLQEYELDTKGGTYCEFCQRTIGYYGRWLHRGMVEALRALSDEQDRKGAPVHATKTLDRAMHACPTNYDYAKLPLFGFCTKGNAGLWKVTRKGRDFLAGNVKAPAYIKIKRNQVVGAASRMVDCSQALQETRIRKFFPCKTCVTS